VTFSLQDISSEEIFANGGEMGACMRSFNWKSTPLGSPETWSPTLRTLTQMLLSNSFPILLWWGPDFIQLYNDAYIPVLGDKHPHKALGKPFRECWSEVYHVLGPLANVPFQGGPSTWIEDIPVELNRYSYKEEAHFTISYSPVPDPTAPHGIGGVIAIVHEISAKIVGDRRVLALRDLAALSSQAKTAEEACAQAAAALASYRKDVPFALVYLLDEKSEKAHLASRTEMEDCSTLEPSLVDLNDSSAVWPFYETLPHGEIVVVKDLAKRFGRVPPGPWSDPPGIAAVVPIKSQMAHQYAGFLVAGISSRLRFDDAYRGFLELASAQIGTSIANARAYEMERRRNEALAELDRAKTTFFSNISHELRTPLTLITGPIEEILANREEGERERLELAYRNSLRMLKLVNTLLDFSRIEAGRVEANYEPTDVCALTADLAGVFRSIIECAGLRLTVECHPLPQPVYLDREMWEKIIFNLLSNAFKFTFEGEIVVSIRDEGAEVEVAVSDTGTGVPAEELPDLFKRFHRVHGAPGRSYEGSGIGLALVQELVRLHGGTVGVESELGKGSRFTISIPYGARHLPAERVREPREHRSSYVLRSDAFLHEAERWLANDPVATLDALPLTGGANATTPVAERELVLVADDNADMREYMARLLEGRYRVFAVSDGAQAVAAIEKLRPALIITDVMMPVVDGFGVLEAVRSSAELGQTPVILLSARAGEESRVEGLRAGADDYIVKPFPARELLARVESHLALSRLRRESAEEIRQSEMRFRALVAASSEAIYEMSPDWAVMRRVAGRQFIADTDAPDRSWLERYVLPEDRPQVMAAIEAAIRTKGVFELEHRVLRADGSVGWTFSRAVPLLDERGEIKEWFGAATDITERKRAEAALLISERLASLGRMAATVSHEINNPLEALTNLIFLAGHSEGLPTMAKECLKEAELELQRVAHITRQALGFYRETTAAASVRIESVIESALELLKGKINAKKAIVLRDWKAEQEATIVVGELRQVFSNLLTNSLDAIDEYGVIKMRTSNYQGRTGPRIRISISDNGKGIDPAVRAHIFQPLYTTKGTTGTGLGLWVTRQLIEKHGGSISVRSCSRGLRTGSTFSVSLPL
jgi:signal transduction histidine kinase